MRVLIDPQYRWQHAKEGGLEYWHIGLERAVKAIVHFCTGHEEASPEEVGKFLYPLEGHFALIAVQGERLIAVADKIRSYPVFYALHQGNLMVSNSARSLKDGLGLSQTEELSVLEFLMSGYVTGRDTLLQGLYQLQAGECLIWHGTELRLELERYYRFFPPFLRQEREDDLLDELREVTDRIFSDAAEEVNGAPIWVPISGGFDSRLVLSKLKELGYPRLRAYSYGPPGNYEAKAARFVCETLGVPWVFVPSTRSRSRRFFHSKARKDYWEFSDGLCSIPFMQDMDTLQILRESGQLPDDAVVINGQSGDFISGGHIPAQLVRKKPTISDLLTAVTDKHFSLWLNIRTQDRVERIGEKVLGLLSLKPDEVPPLPLPCYYEWWEWQERQCKYVVNGQRIYDFLGISWRLPLWETAYLHFWDRIAPEVKYRQALYRKYLTSFGHRKLFGEFSPTIWRWPGAAIGVVPVAKGIGLVLGKTSQERFYKYASYFGHYSNHYAGYGLRYFFKNIGKARGVISFSVARWFKENGLNSGVEEGTLSPVESLVL